MKKRNILILILVVAFALSGCGNSADSEKDTAKDSGVKSEQSAQKVKEVPPLSQEEYQQALEDLITEKNKAYASYTIKLAQSKEKGKFIPAIQIESDNFTEEQSCRNEFESFFGKMVDNDYQYYATTVNFEFLVKGNVIYTLTVDESDHLDAGSSFQRFQLEKK